MVLELIRLLLNNIKFRTMVFLSSAFKFNKGQFVFNFVNKNKKYDDNFIIDGLAKINNQIEYISINRADKVNFINNIIEDVNKRHYDKIDRIERSRQDKIRNLMIMHDSVYKEDVRAINELYR